MNEKKVKVSELDLNNAGSWPKSYKLVACIFVGAFVFALAYFLVIRGKREELSDLETEEVRLRGEFERDSGRALNLEPLQKQLAQTEQVLQQMMRQLPSKTEMPDLIVDISQAALSNGLTNELFQPGEEVKKEFYAEKPIALRMVGGYHQFGTFVSDVASLPRVVIMTMHDISLKPVSPRAGITSSGNLELSGTIKTYRYLDDDETSMQSKSAVGAK